MFVFKNTSDLSIFRGRREETNRKNTREKGLDKIARKFPSAKDQQGRYVFAKTSANPGIHLNMGGK